MDERASHIPALQREEESACAYFEERRSSFDFYIEADQFTAQIEESLNSGFRRFGPYNYTTACPQCSDCVSLRVNVHDFQPSRSQRRLLKKNSDLVFKIVPPRMTAEKWQQYLSYQRHRHPEKQYDNEELYRSMMIQMMYGAALHSEVYSEGGELAGWGALDAGSHSLSTVYFVFDPAFSSRSPGTFSVLSEIEWARHNGYTWYHLGYWIKDHPKMHYKSAFQPAEVLRAGRWQSFSAGNTDSGSTGDNDNQANGQP